MASLRERRLAAGMSLREVAALTGSYHAHVSAVERGLQMPRLDTVYRLARVVQDVTLSLSIEEAIPSLFTQADDGTCRHAFADRRYLDVPGVGGARICERCGATLGVTAWHPRRS